ncbi:MAG: DUF362 domain-containing protein [Bacteroidales bacterium]|nr:DUF362 domain-containing protein [Bacteroidales bacterium]
MKRRDFIRKSVVASIASGALFSMGKWNSVIAAGTNHSLPFDMIAVKNGEPAAMFAEAMKAMGGISTIVRPNQTVVVKPNIGWDASPERGANTNPELVGEIVKQCLVAGAKKVTVFDNTCDEWTRCYKNSGIEKAVKDIGGQIVTGKDQSHYHKVEIPKGIILKETKVHELILESDVFINVPVLKHHGGASVSFSMKNLMGVVWNRHYYHANGLHQCIADFTTFCKPTLNVIDGYRVMKRNGPRGVSVNDVATMKYLLVSKDIVAVDTAATKIFGIDTERVKHIGLAEELNIGTTNLDSLNIKRISI